MAPNSTSKVLEVPDASTLVVPQASDSSTNAIPNTESIATNISHLQQDENAIDLLQSQLSSQPQEAELAEPYPQENSQSEPKQQEPRDDDDDKGFRFTEYKHKSTPNLCEFVKDVNIVKIINQRKNEALLKTHQGHLRSGKRPEDMVSNPMYPKNWKATPYERPPTRNTRKKKLSPKIKRVLLMANAKNWMTQGYTVVEVMTL